MMKKRVNMIIPALDWETNSFTKIFHNNSPSTVGRNAMKNLRQFAMQVLMYGGGYFFDHKCCGTVAAKNGLW